MTIPPCRPGCTGHRLAVAALALLVVLAGVGPGTAEAKPGKRDRAAKPATPLSIVVLQDGIDPVAAARDLGVTPVYVYTSVFPGFAAVLPTTPAARARQSSQVVEISPDQPVRAASQVTPTGVARIAAPENAAWRAAGSSGVDADVAVLDTGIAKLADLNVVGGKACVGKRPYADKDGHGTHVAGIVGARDNDVGVVGVAPGVRLWAVKVLNRNGVGTVASAICGLDWVYKQRGTIDVVNMSLATYGHDGGCSQGAFHRAVCKVVAGGVPVVVAAGNSGDDASGTIPAAWDETIAVSAFTDLDGAPGGSGGRGDDTFAWFSNFGPDVDVAAPGNGILSTWPDGSLKPLGGTSQASPHVAGALALYFATNPGASAADARAWLLTVASRPQDSPAGITGDPDPYHEPVLWLGP